MSVIFFDISALLQFIDASASPACARPNLLNRLRPNVLGVSMSVVNVASCRSNMLSSSISDASREESKNKLCGHDVFVCVRWTLANLEETAIKRVYPTYSGAGLILMNIPVVSS